MSARRIQKRDTHLADIIYTFLSLSSRANRARKNMQNGNSSPSHLEILIGPYRSEFTQVAVIKKRKGHFNATAPRSLPSRPVRTSTARDAHDKSNLQRDTANPLWLLAGNLPLSPTLICSYFRAL